MSGLSIVSFYYILHMCSKIILEYFDVSVWTRSFWKTLESTNVDGKCFEVKMPFSKVSGLMYM